MLEKFLPYESFMCAKNYKRGDIQQIIARGLLIFRSVKTKHTLLLFEKYEEDHDGGELWSV